jgi:3-methylfumaryl-CoA hydratase
MDSNAYDAWLGKSQHVNDTVALGAARHMAAFLDLDASGLAVGDHVPAHWFAILFAPYDAQSKLKSGGHPALGEFLPPVTLPRRAMGGRRIRFHRPLRIGEFLTRESVIQSIQPKIGRSGELCFITVRHDIRDVDATLVITDEQDVVYRAAASSQPTSSTPKPVPESMPVPDIEMVYTPDILLTFRFSAITFNAHRTHYDAAFAREVEGYPDVVVNGSLTTLKIWDFLAQKTGRRVVYSSSRNMKTQHIDRPLILRATVSGEGNVLAWAVDPDGDMVIRADIELAAA